MGSPNYTFIPYEDKYRDDMIFMVLQAKDALGRVPGLNEDLLDIREHYLDTGDMYTSAARNILNPAASTRSTDIGNMRPTT